MAIDAGSVKKISISMVKILGNNSDGTPKYVNISMGSNFNPETFDVEKLKKIAYKLIDVTDGAFSEVRTVITSRLTNLNAA